MVGILPNMRFVRHRVLALPLFILLAVTARFQEAAAEIPKVEFLRDVRPILSSHCFKCHGPDEQTRKSGLRLDVRESALQPASSGESAIVPGNAETSELVARIFASNENDLMPPPSAKHPLSDEQKWILRQWIAEGAEYQPHWAFVPPAQPERPTVQRQDWPRNTIDYFVLARLEREGLQPSPPSSRETLVRRVYLDLIGLPPTPEEAEAYIRDASPDAFEKLVERLLDSPQYGERWTRRWLDLARYADTNGYEKDRPRSIWPYRDWVIRALNEDMPFDQFTIEQIAGDMLPDATLDQRVATGFHRNTMLNEEGGIDPLEFRYYAMVDRVHTTATTWLGLTISCAQCHTHKYDPIEHREYFQFMAFLDNADEPEIAIPQEEISGKRKEIKKQIAAFEQDLASRFPPEQALRWETAKVLEFTSEGGAMGKVLPDGSILVKGENPERDVYKIEVHSALSEVAQIRLEMLTHPDLPGGGPGRAAHGNFVLSEVNVSLASNDDRETRELKLARAEADFSQENFPVSHAIDGREKTGWAIHGPGDWNVDRTAVFTLEKSELIGSGSRWTIRLVQQHGSQHTAGRFRISLGQPLPDPRPIEVRRQKNLEGAFASWLERESSRAVAWSPLVPVKASSNLPLLTIEDDHTTFVSGDQTKQDTYTIHYHPALESITAFRLEALPDDRLPRQGPGRVYYEGPHGDFFLSEFRVKAAGTPLRIQEASNSFASGNNTAAAAIDGDPQTGWSINGGQGREHYAVFRLSEPIERGVHLEVELLFERYYAAGLGKFRLSATSDPGPIQAVGHPAEIQELLLLSGEARTPEQLAHLRQYFLAITPELAREHEELRKLREQMPAYPTTLVMSERPPENPRPTFIHHRGEFLEPRDQVEPGVPSVLHPFPEGAKRDRLNFARWLVSPENPLVGRVIMNREWSAFFGRGLVRTEEDFGFQGELPTHPELLDWLAVEFINQGWSLKNMHKLIVMSATYQQSSRISPDLLERDPENRLLARGPRFRLEAELVRDLALHSSGLLSLELGGPSVFPPQPPGVTSEGTYGPLQWKVSEGEDRYRRGLYTFAKRTAPYAMFSTFDGPSGEACVARREISNSPLQSLTLLNDQVFMEAAQALAARVTPHPWPDYQKAEYIFRRCLTRSPAQDEIEMLLNFKARQMERLEKGELDPGAIAGLEGGSNFEQAAWTLAARVLLNLDETIVKQ
jgi:hypothetical protein